MEIINFTLPSSAFLTAKTDFYSSLSNRVYCHKHFYISGEDTTQFHRTLV